MKRLIKPKDSRYRVLKVLKKAGGSVVVYDRKDRAEAKRYAKVDRLLFSLDKSGLIRYENSLDLRKGTDMMFAIIEDPGREWLEKKHRECRSMWLKIVLALVGLGASLLLKLFDVL